jgi:hypothetical protein
MNNLKTIFWIFILLLLVTELTESGTSGIIPKAGHYQGKPSVSFDVTNDGRITNFEMSASMGEGSPTCNIEISDLKITQTGEFRSEISSNVYIIGKFITSTTVEGTYKITVCPDPERWLINLSAKEEKWNAALK